MYTENYKNIVVLHWCRAVNTGILEPNLIGWIIYKHADMIYYKLYFYIANILN